jgi:hypothetical protein
MASSDAPHDRGLLLLRFAGNDASEPFFQAAKASKSLLASIHACVRPMEPRSSIDEET